MIGLKELILVAFVVLALYGRSGVLKSRQFRTIWPWISPVRRPVARSVSSRGAVRPEPRPPRPATQPAHRADPRPSCSYSRGIGSSGS